MIEALLILFVSQDGIELVRPVPARTIASQPGQIAAGTMLARLIYSDRMNQAVVNYTMMHVVDPGYRADRAMSELNSEHPGVINAIVAAIKPELERGRTEALQALWREMGVAYASRLDAQELAQAIAFHSGPVGRRLADDQIRMIAAAVPGSAAPKQSDADTAAIAAFYRTAAGRKLSSMQTEIASINEAWNKQPDPVTDSRIQAALDKVMRQFR